MDLFAAFQSGLPYADFLARHGSPAHQARWKQTLDRVPLAPAQQTLLASFRRRMPVLCLAGAWCGDCSGQCPIFRRFAEASTLIDLRFVDRDERPDVQAALRINGGNRIPVLVFFSEDGFEVSRYGERTLTRYRQLAGDLDAEACPTGLVPEPANVLAAITAEWLAEFERAQWILRLSPRLRQLHGD